MHRVTDRVKGFYAKTKEPARLNMPRSPFWTFAPPSGVRAVNTLKRFRRFFALRVLWALCELCVAHFLPTQTTLEPFTGHCTGNSKQRV